MFNGRPTAGEAQPLEMTNVSEVTTVEIEKPSTELAIILDLTKPTELFVPKGCDPLIESIRAQAEEKKKTLDPSTKKGQKEIASAAYRVAQVKEAIDKTGKQFVAELKEQVKVIDKERARVWDAVDAIQKDLRAPLDEWEAKEKIRTDAHEKAMAELQSLAVFETEPSSEFVKLRIERLESFYSRDWQEFSVRAGRETVAAAAILDKLLREATDREAEAAVKEQERIAKQIQARKEREEKIRKEAAEKAEREKAELLARLEQQRTDGHRQAIAQMAVCAIFSSRAFVAQIENRITILKERFGRDWEEFAQEAEATFAVASAKLADELEEAKAVEAETERQRKIDEEARAKRLADEAVENERKAQEAARKAEEAAQEKRERNKRHRAKIHREIEGAIAGCIDRMPSLNLEGATDPAKEADRLTWKWIVESISRDEIPHVQINY